MPKHSTDARHGPAEVARSTDDPFPREASGLSHLVEHYAVAQYLPPADWITLLKLERPRRDVRCLGERTRLVKRLVDIAVSASLLVLLAPVMLLVAVLVKVTSPGPVIFRQTRVGLNLRRNRGDRRRQQDDVPPDRPDRRGRRTADWKPQAAHRAELLEVDLPERTTGGDRRRQNAYGRPFVLYKFRTMREDAERDGARFAVAGDPRITPIGQLLRRTRLDELPQLWNVLRGEMSLVGPRPERPEFIERLSDEIPDYLHRLGLKPGLTGIAQVINGYDNDLASFRRKVALDLLYLQNCCFVNDVKILWRTIGVVLTGKGAL